MAKRPADLMVEIEGAKSPHAKLSRSANSIAATSSPTPSATINTIPSRDRAGLSLLCALPDGLLRQAVLPFLEVQEIV
jgi:hypothetical protein